MNISSIMHCRRTIATGCALVCLLASGVYAQTPADAILMKGKEICIAPFYTHDTWNKYWEGSLLRENQNIGQLTRNTYSLMLGYGITDRLNAFVNLPYIRTSASGGQMKGAKGIQDLSLALKYSFLLRESMGFQWNILGTVGYSVPVSSYLSDYMPFSLGLGTSEYSGRMILEARHKTNIYFRGTTGYMHRTTTRAERDYYYADKGYYTDIMDVPDALSIDAALGAFLFDHRLQLECYYLHQNSLSGDDIRRQNAPQPTNRMNFQSASLYARVYPELIKGWSIFANYGQVINGRNVGRSTMVTAGMTYQFFTKKQTL